MKKTVSIILSVLLLLAMFAGCAAKTEKPAPAPVEGSAAPAEAELQDFIHGVYSLEKIDPAVDYQGWGCQRYAVGETLFILDDNLEIQPLLAKDYSLSDDQLTWTINLKDGITFQNGKALDAAAVKADLERLIGMHERAAGQLDIASIAADGNTLTITTNNPNPTFINSLCDPYACIIDVTADVDNTMYAIGTGPYAVKTYNEDVSIELQPYADYWQGTPAAKSLTIKGISDVDTLAMAMQNGEIDSAYGLPYDSLDTFANNASFQVSQTATARVYMLYFNLQNGFTGDANFRKAVCMAVDKETYGEVLINGAGTATKAAFPSSLSYGDDSKMTDVPDYDPEGAKALLAENGYVDADGDGILDKDGKKVTVRIITYGRTGLPQSAQALQSALQELGIDAKFEQFDSVDEVCSSGDFDIAAYACVTTPTGDPYSYLNTICGSTGNLNYDKYSSAEVDTLLAEMAAEFDSAKRAEYATQIQQIITSDSSYCFMFHLNMFMVTKSGVQGIKQSPVDYYHINYKTCRG